MKEYISDRQLVGIIIGFLLGTSIILELGINYAQRDIWIAELLSMFIGFAILLMISYIVSKFPGQDVGNILEHLFGSKLAKFMMLIFIFYSFFLGVLVMNNIGSFISAILMQETPIWVFYITISLTTAIIIRYGFEVAARCIELMTPIILLLLFSLVVIVTLNLVDVNNVLPLFTSKISDIVKATINITAFPYIESILLFFVVVLINKTDKVYSSSIWGLLIGGFLLVIRSLLVVGVFGVNEATKLTFATFMLVREISFREIIERVELSILVVWFLTTYIKLTVCMFSTLKGIQYLFKLNDYKKLALPLAILVVPGAMLAYGNFQEIRTFVNVVWPLVLAPLFILFILIFIFSLAKKDA